MFQCAKEVTKKFEEFFKIKSYSFVMQDGEHAGQKTKHAHIHIIPRDDRNAAGYIQFENQSERNEQEMIEEAETLRHIFDPKDAQANFM